MDALTGWSWLSVVAGQVVAAVVLIPLVLGLLWLIERTPRGVMLGLAWGLLAVSIAATGFSMSPSPGS